MKAHHKSYKYPNLKSIRNIHTGKKDHMNTSSHKLLSLINLRTRIMRLMILIIALQKKYIQYTYNLQSKNQNKYPWCNKDKMLPTNRTMRAVEENHRGHCVVAEKSRRTCDTWPLTCLVLVLSWVTANGNVASLRAIMTWKRKTNK